MNAPSPHLLSLLAVAVELRVNGSTWEEVAAKVDRSARCCRRWPFLFPVEWHRLYYQAEGPFLLEGGRESAAKLRMLIRSDNPRVALPALLALFRQHCAARARFEKCEAAQAACAVLTPDDERALRTVTFLRDMPHEQFNAFLQRLLAALPPDYAGGGAGGEPPAGADQPG